MAGAARNPVLPLTVHVADPEAHVMSDGRLYVYGSSDERDDVYCSDRYRVASTSDLSDWTVHETSFRGPLVNWFSKRDGKSRIGTSPDGARSSGSRACR